MTTIVLLWCFFALLVGAVARSRGRNWLGWALLALVLSPLVAGLLVLALPSRTVLPELEVAKNPPAAPADKGGSPDDRAGP